MFVKYYMRFEDVRVGDKFSKNGYQWFKRSTRTAEIVKGDNAGTWFYFGNKELITVFDMEVA